jgi:hypothetical protein
MSRPAAQDPPAQATAVEAVLAWYSAYDHQGSRSGRCSRTARGPSLSLPLPGTVRGRRETSSYASARRLALRRRR